ncbi:MAG TPA: mechanosensitive ion channel family protein, partial [Methylomirabilota bacterium]|nr:mechanosensitive ion channel family protein [Methylomirabilota bacterium]
TDRALQRRGMEPPMRLLSVRVVRLVVFLFALVVALDKFGFQVAPLVAGIGVAGLGLGIALQGVLSNVVAGLTIIFTKPFGVGEYVELAGVHGDVAAVELFSTTLVHPDRSRVVVPNRKIVGEVLHNFGTTRQLHLSVAVPDDADLGLALGVVHQVLAADARVLKDPAPVVGISRVGDASITLGAHPWVRVADVRETEGALYRGLVEAVRASGVGLAAPYRDVRLVNGASAPR